MADVRIDQLPAAATLDGTEKIALYQNGATVAADAEDVAALAGGGGYTEVTGTLTTGSTTVTLQNAAITASSTIDIYTDPVGVNYTSAVVTTGQIVITFPAQASTLNVKVRVS